MTENINYQFQELCKKGNLKEIKQFYFDNPAINVFENIECAFYVTFWYGHLNVAKWLLKIKPNIKISADNNYAFIWSNICSHLKVAKLLLFQHKTQKYYIFAKNKICKKNN